MPSINMQVLEESRRHQVVQKYEVYPLNNSDVEGYQIEVTKMASNILEDARIIQAGSQLDQWVESKGKVWSKINNLITKTPQTIIGLSGDSSSKDIDDGEATFEFFDDYETGDVAYSASRVAGSSIGFIANTPRIVVADNGTWLMIYRAKSDGSPPVGHEGQVWIRNSTDDGETWSAGTKLSNDVYDAINAEFIKYPNGDIEIFYTRYDDGGSGYAVGATLASKSTDNGSNWSSFTDKSSQFQGTHTVMWQDLTIGSDVYLAGYGNGYLSIYKTTDNGSIWTYISEIAAAADYAEPGLVYLGDGEFVCVLRDYGNGHTLQRRSTNWGVTWTTDGYIKNDGQVLALGIGTDVVLHQCRIWNKDINGNDLGYVYMHTNLYPGGYPRDMYAYFSTDDCASWGSRSLIYNAADCTEGETVLKTSTAAKYYTGKIAGASNTTEDDITISSVIIPFVSKWDSYVSNVTISTDQAFRGSKSAKFPIAGILTRNQVHSDNIAFKYWAYFPSAIGEMYPFLHGDGISRLYFSAGYSNPGELWYNDGSWRDTGANIITSAWASFEAKDFRWASHTQDLLYNNVEIASNVGQSTSVSNDDDIRINSSSTPVYVDCFLVRKYTIDEPIITEINKLNRASLIKALGSRL